MKCKKVKYDSFLAAKAARKNIEYKRKKRGLGLFAELTIYLCQECKCYHHATKKH